MCLEGAFSAAPILPASRLVGVRLWRQILGGITSSLRPGQRFPEYLDSQGRRCRSQWTHRDQWFDYRPWPEQSNLRLPVFRYQQPRLLPLHRSTLLRRRLNLRLPSSLLLKHTRSSRNQPSRRTSRTLSPCTNPARRRLSRLKPSNLPP